MLEKENIDLESEEVLDNNVINEDNINIEEYGIDELIDLITTLRNHQNPFSISKKVEIIKALFYKKLNNINIEKKADPREESFKKLHNEYKKNKNEFRKKVEKIESENLKIKNEIIEEIKELTSEVELKKDTFNKFRDLQKKWQETGHVSIRFKNETWQMYNHYVEVFYDYLKLNKDLRDIDFRKNLEEKTVICIKAENLISIESLNDMHRQLQELHDRWKNTGPVKQKIRDEIWLRFQDASRKINKKRNDHFLEIKKNDKKRFNAKNEICKEIISLGGKGFNSHKECLSAIEECENLSKKWKSLGRINQKDNKACWKEFKEALNKFYKIKNQFYKNRKDDNKQIIDLKNKLCDEAGKLEKDTDWDSTTRKYIKLQKQWKETGFLNGKLNNELWGKFKGSCDNFFKSKKESLKKIKQDELKKINEKKNLISLILNLKKTKEPKKDISLIKANIKKWNKIEKTTNSFKIDTEFNKACVNFLKDLEIDKKEVEKEINLISASLLTNNPKGLSKKKSNIKEKLNEKKKEINLFENNKSYIVITKNKNPLLDKVEKKINSLATEINQLQEELRILNSI
jgi:hypothetical protein